MALSRTDLHGSISAEGIGTDYTTASFSPPSNSLLVVAVGVMVTGALDAAAITCSGGGWTFTQRVEVDTVETSFDIGVAIFTAPVSTGASMTITAGAGAGNENFVAVSAVAYTSYNTGTPTGATGSNQATGGTEGAISLTLSGAPATTSEVFAAIVMDKESIGCTPGAAFSEIHEVQVGSAGGLETEIRNGSTSTTVDWVDAHTGTGTGFKSAEVALEIIEGTGPAVTEPNQWTPRPLVGPYPRLMRTGVLAPLQLMGDKATPFAATDATVTAAAIVTTAALPAPAIQTGSTVTATAIVTTTGAPAPSLQTGSVVAATAIATVTAMPAPTVVTAVLAFPPVIVTTTTLTAPAVQTGSTVVATAIATTTAVPAVLVPIQVNATAVATTTALPTPAIQTGSTVATTAVATAIAMSAPVVSTGTTLTRTDLLTSSTGPTHGTGPYTTAAFTPPDFSMLVVAGMAIEDGGSSACVTDLTISDSETLTWTSRIDESGDDGGSGDYTTGTRIWTALVTTGVSMTVSLDLGARSAGIYAVSIVAYNSYDSVTPIGATGKNNQGFAPSAAPQQGSLTLSAPPSASSEVFAAVGVNHNDIAGITPGTGWSEIHDSADTAWGGLQSQSRGASTSAAVIWDSLNPSGDLYNYAAVAVEINAAAGGVDATFTPTTIATTAGLPVPAFQTGQVVSAVAIDTVTVLPAVVVSASGSADANQAGIHIPWMFVLPSEASFQLQGTATTPANPNATVAPPSIATTTTLTAPVVQTGSTIAAITLATVTALPVPSFQTGSVVSTLVLATVTALPAPSISAGGGTTVAATSVATVTALPVPAVQTGQRVNPATLATVTSLTAPTVTTVTDATVAATALATVTALPAPVTTAGAVVSATTLATVTALPLAAVVGNVFPGIPGHGQGHGPRSATGNAYPRSSGGIIGRAG